MVLLAMRAVDIASGWRAENLHEGIGRREDEGGNGVEGDMQRQVGSGSGSTVAPKEHRRSHEGRPARAETPGRTDQEARDNDGHDPDEDGVEKTRHPPPGKDARGGRGRRHTVCL